MSQISRIAEVEDALIALLKKNLLDVKNIGTLTSQDFKDDDTIVTDTPAIKLFFSGDQLKPQELTALLYDSKQIFMLLCGAQNLRGETEERRGAYELVAEVCDLLAGARLTLPSHAQRPQVSPVQVRLMQTTADGTWYAIEIAVEHYHLFSGVAAA